MSIWDHKEIRKTLNPDSLIITMNEGDTPELELTDANSKLILKREDKNPTGSWKDRGTAYKLTLLLSKGINQAVIASSGNAAISLMTYANQLNNFKLHVVISNKTSSQKRNLINSLARDYHQVYEVENIRVKSVELASELKIPNLKVSVDDEILPGYWSLGLELSKHFKNQDNSNSAIFIPVSSGTTLVGMVQGLHLDLESEYNLPKIIAVQTQRVHPIVSMLSEALDKEGKIEDSEESLADAIIDKTALRSPQILKIIKETQGLALSITDEEIMEAIGFLKQKGIEDSSYTSVLSVAGYLRAKDIFKLTKSICILSGR